MTRNFGIEPYNKVESLTIAENGSLTEAFDGRRYMGGQVMVPGAWTAANIAFMVCDTLAGTYVLALDKDGIPVQITNVNTGRAGAYSVPTELFPMHFVKLFSKSTTAATETATNQAAARTMKVMLK